MIKIVEGIVFEGQDLQPSTQTPVVVEQRWGDLRIRTFHNRPILIGIVAISANLVKLYYETGETEMAHAANSTDLYEIENLHTNEAFFSEVVRH